MREQRVASPIVRLINTRNWHTIEAETLEARGQGVEAGRHWGIVGQLNVEIVRLERAATRRSAHERLSE
jgi:hypothetical protein